MGGVNSLLFVAGGSNGECVRVCCMGQTCVDMVTTQGHFPVSQELCRLSGSNSTCLHCPHGHGHAGDACLHVPPLTALLPAACEADTLAELGRQQQ